MWKEEYALGVAHIDGQHKSLFEKAGELTALVNDGVDKNKQEIIEIVTFLKGYALNHFRSEEEYQASINYIGLNDHKEEHIAFIKTVLKHEQELLKSDFSEAEVQKFTTTLNGWLVEHVSGSDQKIVGKKPIV